jgi:probable addiction module antidote protein
MSKKIKSYRDWLGAKLASPERAVRYLNAAAEDSEAMFLKALRKVASSQARPMAEIAETCGISRESLYRMLSETGNPSSENRRAILAALGLKSIVVPLEKARIATGVESEGSNNTIAVQGTFKGNTFLGGSARYDSFLPFGLSPLAVAARKGPIRAAGNFVTVGYLEERSAQTGVHH